MLDDHLMPKQCQHSCSFYVITTYLIEYILRHFLDNALRDRESLHNNNNNNSLERQQKSFLICLF